MGGLACIPANGEPRATSTMRTVWRRPFASPHASARCRFSNTVTVFGTPNDVTLAELALEMLFPADAKTIEIGKRMVEEQATASGSFVRELVA